MNKQEFLEAIKDKKLAIGFNATLKAVKDKKAEMVIATSTCPADKLALLKKVEPYEGTSRDLAVALGKPFNVSVVAVMK